MKKVNYYKFVFAGLAVITIACSKGMNNPEVVRSLLDDYEEALGSKSAEKIAQVFHEQATILPEGKNVVQGRAGIAEHFKDLETMNFEEKFIVDESFRAGEYIVVQTKNLGKWSIPDKHESGEFEVKGQMILKQNQKKEWKIFRYAYSGNEPPEESRPKEIEGKCAHSVFFWLKDPKNENVRDRFKTSLEKFIENSQYVKSMHIGTPAQTNRPVIDNSYTYSLIVTFPSKEEHDEYQQEEVHQIFIEEAKELWEKVLVYDSEMN